VAAARGEQARATRWREHAAALRVSLEQAWDGDWYRRGYFDDGTALGSASSSECRIDSIAQSWGVICGAADSGRARLAMSNVESRLILRDPGLALLFTPPFDRTSHDPGYIKGYPPGIRENGGQYTHAAAWTVIAQAMLGYGDRRRTSWRSSTPSITPAAVPTCSATKSSPTWWPRMSIRWHPMSGEGLVLVHRFGRLDVSSGFGVGAGISSQSGLIARDAVHSGGLAKL